MIKITSPDELKSYFDLPDAAVEFLKNATTDTANGRYDISPDCFIKVMNCTTDEDLTAPMEAHDVFVDVQYIIAGEEQILYRDRADLKICTPYNAEKDVLFYQTKKADKICYQAGQAVILYPEDAHLPGRAVRAPMTIKKAVLKLRHKK